MKRDASTSPLRRVHIVGRQNSGKTTLIVELVEYLTAGGWRVGTIKHTHHHHELDVPGKDSFRHRDAGAAPVGIIAPGMNAIFWPETAAHDDENRYSKMLRMFQDCDLVLVEGHLMGDGIKVEVWRTANGRPPLANDDCSIRAVVTDDVVSVPVPVWSRLDVAKLADLITKLDFKTLPQFNV